MIHNLDSNSQGSRRQRKKKPVKTEGSNCEQYSSQVSPSKWSNSQQWQWRLNQCPKVSVFSKTQSDQSLNTYSVTEATQQHELILTLGRRRQPSFLCPGVLQNFLDEELRPPQSLSSNKDTAPVESVTIWGTVTRHSYQFPTKCQDVGLGIKILTLAQKQYEAFPFLSVKRQL